MHIADMDKGMLGANGIVGGGPPLACGSGLTAKSQQDGSSHNLFFRGRRFRARHVAREPYLASIWKLPIIFCSRE